METEIGTIRDLVHRYADAVVHRDEAAWAATWAEHAVWEVAGATLDGRAAIIDAWRSVMSGFGTVVQNVTNGTATLDPATGSGSGRWYVTEHAVTTGGRPLLMLGHYDDDYVVDGEHAGTWLFARRSLTVHYAGAPDLSSPVPTRRT